MKKYGLLLVFFFFVFHLSAQTYDDFLGAGHSQGFSVTSSDDQSDGISSVDGAGLNLEIRPASRFLAHSTLGFTIDDVRSLTEQGFDDWINQQMALPASEYTDISDTVRVRWYQDCLDRFNDSICQQRFMGSPAMWRAAWWDNAMKGDDQLRQRVAMALSEILVISDQSNLRFLPEGIGTYYEILMDHAFGNYEELLKEISTNMAMGFYLSHLNNPPTDTVANIRPDENYAREIMQLFTIGLYELNMDGSRKLDNSGLWIPTYDNDDIKGLAKVFTGLSGSEWARESITTPTRFGQNYRRYSFRHPMKMFEAFHELGEKEIVGGHIIPAGQTGMEDIDEAIHVLFNHDNMGPFLALRLIQRLVKSNPSPEYVRRVAEVFNDNGTGVRGDMAALVKAILLDDEAYECYFIEDMANGMLRSPMLRYTQLMRGLRAEVETDIFYNSGATFLEFTGQHVLSSPTVFNFYSPDYEPNADFSYYNMVGPEYQILNSSTSSNYVNFILLAVMGDYLNDRFPNADIPNYLNGPLYNPYDRRREPYEATLTDELWLQLGYSPEELVDYLDILLTNGSLSEDAKERVITSISDTSLFAPEEAAHYALFLIMIDPDFTVMK